MRSGHDQEIALECLRLACTRYMPDDPAGDAVAAAVAFFAFVTGSEADDAKTKLDAVRNIIT